MTGFVAVYDDGARIEEINNFFDLGEMRQCATNWSKIDQSRVVQLELWWQDRPMVRIRRPQNLHHWIFHHTGTATPGGPTSVFSRSIGFVETGGAYFLWTVEESTGRMTIIP